MIQFIGKNKLSWSAHTLKKGRFFLGFLNKVKMNFIIIPDGYMTPQHGNFSTNFYITGGSKQKTQDQRAFFKHFWP